MSMKKYPQEVEICHAMLLKRDEAIRKLKSEMDFYQGDHPIQDQSRLIAENKELNINHDRLMEANVQLVLKCENISKTHDEYQLENEQLLGKLQVLESEYKNLAVGTASHDELVKENEQLKEELEICKKEDYSLYKEKYYDLIKTIREIGEKE